VSRFRNVYAVIVERIGFLHSDMWVCRLRLKGMLQINEYAIKKLINW